MAFTGWRRIWRTAYDDTSPTLVGCHRRPAYLHTGGVIPRDLALALRDAGLLWSPQKGDRFAVLDHDLDDEVFVLSDMVIERMQPPNGQPIFTFNGTVEWARDSLEAAGA